MATVFRIQHKSTELGPYYANCPNIRYDYSVDHPEPTKWLPNGRFGFFNWTMMRNWFWNDDEVRTLHKEDYEIVVLRIRDKDILYWDDSQIAFAPDKGHVIARYSVLDLLSKFSNPETGLDRTNEQKHLPVPA